MSNYTKSQLKILKAANAAFIAMKAANPDLWYDSSGGHLMSLRFSDGTVLDNVRPDCSGMMRAIIMYMGYDMVGSSTYSWYGHTTNDIIRDRNGGYSEDWVVKTFDPADRQPGDILVTSGHCDMYVFTDANGSYRGFNAGAGNHGSSISIYGMEYSVNLAEYYNSTGSWTDGGPEVGGYTIEETLGVTLIRYVGAGSDPASGVKEFITTQPIYDVSGWQDAIVNDFDPSFTGGLIIQVCRLKTYGVGTDDASNDNLMTRVFKAFVNRYKGVIPLGFYFYSYLPYSTSEGNSKDAIRKCFQFMESVGINPDLAPLGVWLDTEADGPTPVSKDVNIKQVQWFRAVAAEKGYITSGVYGSAFGDLETLYNYSDLADIPIWVAWYDTTQSAVESWAESHGLNQVLLWQSDASHQISGHDVDFDIQLKPIQYGIDDYTSGESGTSNTGTGSYEIVPAKQIIFTPTPGLVPKGTIVSITTDAPNARIFVTFDNTVPNFHNSSQDWTNKRFVFDRNYHLRAYAFDESGTVVARGAATYTIPWVRPSFEQADQAIEDIRAAQTLSQQYYLQKHTSVTVEDIVEYELDKERGEN